MSSNEFQTSTPTYRGQLCARVKTPAESTYNRERWRAEVRDLVLRCVPDADPARINVAVHQIVDQLDSVWRGARLSADFTKWRGAFGNATQEGELHGRRGCTWPIGATMTDQPQTTDQQAVVTGQTVESTRCEHDWQVEGINLRRDGTGVLECSKCGSRQEDVVLTDDQIWRFISDHVIG